MMTVAVSSVGPETGCRSVSQEPASRVLFAVTKEESNLFFGTELPPLFLAESHRYSAGDDGVRWRECLEEVRPEVIVSCWDTPAIPLEWLRQKDCPLRYVCHLSGATRGVVPREFLVRGGKVTNWGTLVAEQVAEHALLLALAALRQISGWKNGCERCRGTTKTLFRKNVGIHGFGSIARALCQLLAPFNVKIKAFSYGVPPELMISSMVTPCETLREVFAGSDVVFDCEALTEVSEKSVTAEFLAAMPDGAVFVNVGRGRVVDEIALGQEAARGRLRVAVDVVVDEPLPKDSPIAILPDVIYSPHIAGPTGDHYLPCGRHALENLDRYFRKLPLHSEVTLEIYDRST